MDYLKKPLETLFQLGLKPLFGVELEFYILGIVSDKLLESISNEIGIEVQTEKGYEQYEIASMIFDDIFVLIDYINSIKKRISDIALNYGNTVSFSAKPFPDDYGSGMHIHMSFLDDNNKNIFNNYDTINENYTLLNVIGGILALVNKSLYMIISQDKSEFDRLHNSDLTPSTVSWGKNNRTTAIRIPDSHPNNRNRRLEFRVPSSSSNIANCINFLLTSAIYGIKKRILPATCIYGNANDSTYNLTSLHKNADDMKAAFCFWDIFNSIFNL